MARRTTEPAAPVDAYNPAAGPDALVAYGHTVEEAARLREITEAARHRQASGLPPVGSQSVQSTPSSAPRVDARLASQLRDKQIGALRADMARLMKEADRSPVGASGQVVPHLAERQRAVQSGIEAATREVERLAALDGRELIDWAVTSGLIRFTQDGSAVL